MSTAKTAESGMLLERTHTDGAFVLHGSGYVNGGKENVHLFPTYYHSLVHCTLSSDKPWLS